MLNDTSTHTKNLDVIQMKTVENFYGFSLPVMFIGQPHTCTRLYVNVKKLFSFLNVPSYTNEILFAEIYKINKKNYAG